MEQAKDPEVDHSKLKQPQWPLHIVYESATKLIKIHIGEEIRPPRTPEEELYVLDRNFSVIVNAVASVMGFLTKAGFERAEVENRVFIVLDAKINNLNDSELPPVNWVLHVVELMHSKQVNIYRDKTVAAPNGVAEERAYMWFELRILTYCLVNQMAVLIKNGVPYESMMGATRQVIDQYLNVGATSAENKKVEVKMFPDAEVKPAAGEFWVIKLVNRNNPAATGWLIGENAKGIMVDVSQNGALPAGVKQFKTEQLAQVYIRDKKLNRNKEVSALILSNKQLSESDFKNVAAVTDEHYLQSEDGSRVFFDAAKDEYYLDKKDIGYCLWKKAEADKAAIELSTFFGKTISAVPVKNKP